MLGLLARGHTAKSIATLTDRSVGAVNERLREARRKTGIGSSRELARMFAAQENRDEFIGVASSVEVAPDAVPPAILRRSWKGTALMSAALVIALGTIVLLAQPAPQTVSAPAATPAPSSGDTLYSDAPSPKQLHDRIMAEPRDAAWASKTEAALKQWFASQPMIANVASMTKAQCSSSMCEIATRWRAKMPVERLNAAMQLMQGKAFRDAIEPMGLDFNTGGFGDDDAILFVSRRPG
ncbi:MAG TPA: hypothetical protein VN137_10440 [Sphingomonas sp.]|nr:hypothetical protein [Sphingomonas sp.]